MIHENVKEIRRNSSDLGLGVRFKSCVTVQAPAQFGTHKNDSFQVFRIRNLQRYSSLHNDTVEALLSHSPLNP